MPKGGARNHSGPPADPTSARSDRRGYSLTALPAEGFLGDVPAFPLPPLRVLRWETEDKRRFQVFDEEESERFAEREAQLWAWAWSTPQACAWSMPSQSWRCYAVAMWVRTATVCESSEATAADKNSLHRFADQIGFTDAGLAQMGWKVATDELAAKAAERQQSRDDSADDEPVVRRLRSTDGVA